MYASYILNKNDVTIIHCIRHTIVLVYDAHRIDMYVLLI